MRSIKEAQDLKDKRVLVRVDWSVPDIANDYQIRVSLPTLKFLEEQGAKIIVATHTEGATIEELKKYLPPGAEILPNLRDNPGEKGNSEEFARELAGLADIYVNDAFAVSHREHASIVGVPKFLPHFAGLQLMEEINMLSKAFNPSRPFLFILGGAKFETKEPLVEKFINIADEIFIAGANAKPASLLPLSQNPKVVLPLGDISALDADETNLNLLSEKIAKSAFIVWNGPLGKYEEGHQEGTKKLAQILAQSGKEVIVGGGDTLTAIYELNLFDKFTFVSTGGGAMLDFLSSGTLPGVEALA